MGCAGGAKGIALQGERALAAAQGVPAAQNARFGPPAQHRHGGAGHGGADEAAEGRGDARFGAGGERAWGWWTFEETAQARRPAGEDGDELAGPAEGGAVHQRDAAPDRLVVGVEAGCEIVGSVEDDVGSVEQLARRGRLESRDARHGAQSARGHLRLEGAHVGVAEEDLAGEVRALDAVGVDQHQPQLALAFFGERERRGAAETSHSEDDGGLHGAPSRLNSRSPAAVTSAMAPGISRATSAAAALACDARTPVSRASLRRASAASARLIGRTSLKSLARGRSGISWSAATSAILRPLLESSAARAPAGATTTGASGRSSA